MSGVMWSRKPEQSNSGAIHLWVRDGDGWRAVCSSDICEEVEKRGNSILIENAHGDKAVLEVIQKESFKRANSGYCAECIDEHPKNDGSWESAN